MIEGQTDINNIRRTVPFQKFPMHVYKAAETPGQVDHPGNKTRLVHSEAGLAQALKRGWSEKPIVPAVEDDDNFDSDDFEEVEAESAASAAGDDVDEPESAATPAAAKKPRAKK